MTNNEYLEVIKKAIDMISNAENFWKKVVKDYEEKGQEAEFSKGMMTAYRNSVGLLLRLIDGKPKK